MRIAFEILNARYNARLTTLISSELDIGELSKVDGAVAGRIKEMSGLFLSNIHSDESRDYRWRTQR